MRKLLLLVGLSMMAVLVFAPAASAEHNAAHVRAGSDGDPCPDPDYPRLTPDGCQASNLPDVEFGNSASATPSATPSATASASASVTASPTASPTASASTLPATGGGFSPALALGPLALIVGGGLLAIRIVRR